MVQYHIMKNWKLFISYLIFTGILFFSCATNSTEKLEESQSIQPEEPEIIVPEPTAEELFIQEMNNYSLEFTKIPAKIKKGKQFAADFEVTVLNENLEPAADFDVCFLYPAKKEGTQIVYATSVVKTNENGIAAFNPGTVNFCAKTVITAYPAIPSELEIDYKAQLFPVANADFAVESDIAAKGAILFVFEYNENGKSPKNSYDILSGLRKKGVTMIGNAPISDTSYINASKEKIYKENYEYVGTDFGYLIGGTIKFVNPVEKNEDGTYTASMIADIYGIDMKTGEVIYEQTIENTSDGANWNKAVDSCNTKLTADVVDSIMFGL